jgi:Ala-tRNA(Pro) deacylase
MPLRRLTEYLDVHKVEYETIRHAPAFTAQGVAHTAHISGREIAKSVVLTIDGRMALAVLPASERVDLSALRYATDATHVELADEQTFKDRFPGCEVGAMPPFGNLYGMDVFVSESLTRDEMIAFNAGSHTELLRMKYEDFARLVRPRVLSFEAIC